MRWTALLALCGCNSIFGMHEITERDATFYDAPADAASTCPSGHAPEYSPVLHQVVLQRCESYSIVAGRATCMCFVPAGFGICEGPAGGELPLIDLGLAGFVGQVDQPRLTPDTNELFVRAYDYDTSLQAFYGYVRRPDGTWQRGTDPPFAAGVEASLGTFASTPSGIRTIVTTFADGSRHEWVRESGQWRELPAQGPVPAGSSTTNMTLDGLHAIVGRSTGAEYFERAGLDAVFEPAQPMPGVPGESVDATLADDCGRVYVTGLGGVFYVQRN